MSSQLPPLVFVHGWGQSPRIWHAQVEHFSSLCPVSTPALPGHGGAADAPAGAWLELLAAALPDEPAVLVGWSLGGMLAMQLAMARPARVAGLALISTTPCFRNRGDWAHGCDDAAFRAFEQGVAEQSSKLLGRFFALMLQGDGLARPRYNALAHAAVDRAHPPTAMGLAEGLGLLDTLDLRPGLAAIAQPAWVAHGDDDAVIPAAAGRFLADHIPGSAWHGFDHCGHAPFLTQPDTFNAQLEAWCRNISSHNG